MFRCQTPKSHNHALRLCEPRVTTTLAARIPAACAVPRRNLSVAMAALRFAKYNFIVDGSDPDSEDEDAPALQAERRRQQKRA